MTNKSYGWLFHNSVFSLYYDLKGFVFETTVTIRGTRYCLILGDTFYVAGKGWQRKLFHIYSYKLNGTSL